MTEPPNPYGPTPYGQGPYPQDPGPQDPGPQYPGPQYPYGQPPYGTPAPVAPATAGRVPSVGPRSRRRPDARFSPAMAAAGAALVVIGVLVWSIGYFAAGFHLGFTSEDFRPKTSGEGRRFFGAGLFLVLAVAGYAVVILRRRGPLATAGVVASAAGVPLALTFAFLDISGTLQGQFPTNIDAVSVVSIVVWLVSYVAIPGARGRAVYLGLAATFIYGYAAFKADGTSLLRTGVTVSGTSSSGGGIGGSTATGSIAALGLVFGLGYYAIAAFLDHRGRSGAAIGLVFAAFGATVAGLIAGANSFGQIGIGVTLLIVSAALSSYGGHFGRRFTTWIWAAGFAVGVGVIVDKITPHSYLGSGILLVLVGLAVAAGAAAVASTTNEPIDLDDDPTVAATQPRAAAF